MHTTLDSQKNVDRHVPVNRAKFCQPSDFFLVGKCLPEGSERSEKQKFLTKKLTLYNVSLIAREHLHTHLNKLRWSVDCAPQTVI